MLDYDSTFDSGKYFDIFGLHVSLFSLTIFGFIMKLRCRAAELNNLHWDSTIYARRETIRELINVQLRILIKSFKKYFHTLLKINFKIDENLEKTYENCALEERIWKSQFISLLECGWNISNKLLLYSSLPFTWIVRVDTRHVKPSVMRLKIWYPISNVYCQTMNGAKSNKYSFSFSKSLASISFRFLISRNSLSMWFV